MPITLDQQGSYELKEEILHRPGVKLIDINAYELRDLDDIKFFWANCHLELNAAFRHRIYFSPTPFEDLEMGGSAKNPILLDEEKDRKKLSPELRLLGNQLGALRC